MNAEPEPKSSPLTRDESHEVPFVDFGNAFKRRWTYTDDGEIGGFVHKILPLMYEVFCKETFDTLVELWQKQISDDGQITNHAKLLKSARRIFTNLNTDKVVIIFRASDCKSTNQVLGKTLLRRAIAFAVHQQAVLNVMTDIGIMPGKEMSEHRLLPNYWYNFDIIFNALYPDGTDKPAVKLTNRVLDRFESETYKKALENYLERNRSKEKKPKFSVTGILGKDFEGAEWSDVYLRVELAGVTGTEYCLKIKRKGQKVYKTYELNELGFVYNNGRKLEMFSTLKMLAECDGFFDPVTKLKRPSDDEFPKKRARLKKRIQYLREHFVKIFQIVHGDPIRYYKRDRAWWVQFSECGVSVRDVKTSHPSDKMLDPRGKLTPTSSSDAMDDAYKLSDPEKTILHRADNDDSNKDELSFRDNDELE